MRTLRRTFARVLLAVALATAPVSALAGSLTDYQEPRLLQAEFGAVAYTATVTHYIALYTVAPTDSTAGTEVTGGSYARVALTNNTTNWVLATSTVSNGTAVTFPTATGSWGTVVAFCVTDAASAGNRLACSTLTTSYAVVSGDLPRFSIGTLTISLD